MEQNVSKGCTVIFISPFYHNKSFFVYIPLQFFCMFLIARKQMRRCANLLKRFPDSDEEALKEKFPLVDIPMVKRWKRVLGHHHNLEYDIYENPNNPYGNK